MDLIRTIMMALFHNKPSLFIFIMEPIFTPVGNYIDRTVDSDKEIL